MFLSIMILIAVGCGLREHWARLTDHRPEWDQLLIKWLAQGMAAPLAIWGFLNLGLSSSFPALIPEIAVAQAAGQSWFAMWIAAMILGAGFIAICWSMVTYSFLAFLAARRGRGQSEFRTNAAVVGLPMLCLSLFLVHGGRWTDLPNAVLLVFVPIVHMTLSTVEKPLPKPMYGAAQGKINFGKYEEAEIEVINQLEKQDNDFEGWMLLAELYATKYHRLEDAAKVIVDLCNDPAVREVEISVACNKLADWQLEIGMNPPAARAALDLIVQRAPGTHVARMAEQRLEQMPRTREDLLDEKKPRSIRLSALREQPPSLPQADAQTRQEASVEVNRLTDRLRANPNDHNARERLAILMAERLGQVTVGVEQLRCMIKLPDIPPERAAKWLAQIATWERALNKNETKFRAILNEILRDYPNTTQAYGARRQLQLIENDSLAALTPPPPTRPIIRIEVPKSS